MRRNHPSGEDGFTIVEALVAATILVIGLLATLALVDRATGSTSSSKQRDVANALAEELVERAQGGRYTTTRNDMTDVDPAAALKGPADRLRAALDPDADSSSTTVSPATVTAGSVPLLVPQSWTLKRKNTIYTVSYRGCTHSDPYQQVQIGGPFDCDRPNTNPGGNNETTQGTCSLGLIPPSAVNPADPAPLMVRMQVLNITGLSACVGAISPDLATSACWLLGHSTLLDSVTGALLGSNGLVAQLFGGVLSISGRACDASQIDQALAGVKDGIASSTRLTVTVAWTDADRRAQSITQTAVVRRPST
jgi:type II secretory pathway pseudopilin PulG